MRTIPRVALSIGCFARVGVGLMSPALAADPPARIIRQFSCAGSVEEQMRISSTFRETIPLCRQDPIRNLVEGPYRTIQNLSQPMLVPPGLPRR